MRRHHRSLGKATGICGLALLGVANTLLAGGKIEYNDENWAEACSKWVVSVASPNEGRSGVDSGDAGKAKCIFIDRKNGRKRAYIYYKKPLGVKPGMRVRMKLQLKVKNGSLSPFGVLVLKESGKWLGGFNLTTGDDGPVPADGKWHEIVCEAILPEYDKIVKARNFEASKVFGNFCLHFKGTGSVYINELTVTWGWGEEKGTGK